MRNPKRALARLWGCVDQSATYVLVPDTVSLTYYDSLKTLLYPPKQHTTFTLQVITHLFQSKGDLS